MIFLNEREVTLSRDGILTYYHFDKPGVAKGSVDLTSTQVQSVRFIYAGGATATRKSQEGGQQVRRPTPNIDDEIRIILSGNARESFVFRASKLTQ